MPTGLHCCRVPRSLRKPAPDAELDERRALWWLNGAWPTRSYWDLFEIPVILSLEELLRDPAHRGNDPLPPTQGSGAPLGAPGRS